MTTIRSDAAYASLVQGTSAASALARSTPAAPGRAQSFADFSAFDGPAGDNAVRLPGAGGGLDVGHTARQVAALLVDA